MAQIQRPRVGVLRTSLHKSCAYLGNWHAQRLAAEDEKISAVLQISFDRLPGIGWHRRSVRKHQQLGVLESAGDSQGLQVQKTERIVQRRGQGGAIDGWLATVGKPGCQKTAT